MKKKTKKRDFLVRARLHLGIRSTDTHGAIKKQKGGGLVVKKEEKLLDYLSAILKYMTENPPPVPDYGLD